MAKEEGEHVPHLPWMRNPVKIKTFKRCSIDRLPSLDPRLQDTLRKMQIEKLFPVQVAVWFETIGPGAFERDICVNSSTGSGKTLAYALPIVQMLSTKTIRNLRALVVLPTRDLALQVKEVFDPLAQAMGLSVGIAVGQSSIADEISGLIKSPKTHLHATLDPYYSQLEPHTSVDILVATPGRLMDHINMTKGFSLEHLQFLVVDETERLLREAYQSWLPMVIQLTCPTDRNFYSHDVAKESHSSALTTVRRLGVERGFKGKCYPRLVKLILSATLTEDPSKLSQLDLHHPLLLTGGRYEVPESLVSYKLDCGSNPKLLCLIVLLKRLQGEKCLVFTSSTQSAHKLCTLLRFFSELPFEFGEYSSLQRQYSRSKMLEAFERGKIMVLISTDGLARGIDIEGVRNVINYDMPAYIKTYIHRAGRTARASKPGCCFTLLRKNELKRFDKLLLKAKIVPSSFQSMSKESIQNLLPAYKSAKEKLEEYIKMEEGKRKLVSKVEHSGKRKRPSQSAK